MKLCELDGQKLDVIAELCNIGAGHAASSLSKLLNRLPVRLTVPHVRVVQIAAVPDLIGGPERFVGAVHLLIQGSITGSLVVLFDEDSSRSLLGLLLKKEGRAVDFGDSMVISTLGEVGNIIASAFLGAFSTLTRARLLPSTPRTAFDMAGAVLDEVLMELAKAGDEALFVEITMQADEQKFHGQLFIVPDSQTLDQFNL